MKLLTLRYLGQPLFKSSPFVKVVCNANTRYRSSKKENALETAKYDSQVSTNVRPLAEKVRETAKTTSYLGVILLGGGITVAMFYTIFSELFSKNSPNSIYSRAFDTCASDPKVEDLLGPPIKGHGEETRRGRRGHVSHSLFLKNGVKHLRMRFYIKGTRNSATVNLEMKEVNGNFDYNYLQVLVDDYSRHVITLIDNTKPTTDLKLSESQLVWE